MRALVENLTQIEDRVLWALLAMVAAYLAWGVWAAVRERRRSARPSGPAEPAPGSNPDPNRPEAEPPDA